GLSLADLVERHGPLPPERVVHLLRQVCAALHEAHGQGLIHRDLKPANIFAAQRGGIEDVAKLLDFGLVRQTGDGPGESQLLVGSPPYMSPEQAAASAALDPRSDIYALGAVAYCLLTGQPPFRCDTVQEYVQAHLRQPVLPPALVQPGVPPDLERVVLCCLEKVPDRRFPDVAALDRALGTCACAEQWTAARAAQWWQAQRATLDSAGLPGAASWPSHAEPAPSPRPEQTVRVVMPGLGDS
ncbi:MAG: serine/threonine protein kinase, partial [Planctomycetia bacterium]|nr:serine/threonine protein kinase [Planctomycetia bacterium]